MPLGQSIIVGFIAGEVAGYIAEQSEASPKDVRLTKCVVAAGAGIITSVVTADPVGIVGALLLATAYLGGYDPVYMVAEAFSSVRESRPKK